MKKYKFNWTGEQNYKKGMFELSISDNGTSRLSIRAPWDETLVLWSTDFVEYHKMKDAMIELFRPSVFFTIVDDYDKLVSNFYSNKGELFYCIFNEERNGLRLKISRTDIIPMLAPVSKKLGGFISFSINSPFPIFDNPLEWYPSEQVKVWNRKHIKKKLISLRKTLKKHKNRATDDMRTAFEFVEKAFKENGIEFCNPYASKDADAWKTYEELHPSLLSRLAAMFK